jgi:hypothetical protein
LNFLVLLGIGAFGFGLLWAVQSIALWMIGEPLAWPLRFETRDPRVKLTSRVMIHTMWLIIIVGTPLALNISPREWFYQEFPTPVPWRDMAMAFWIMLLPVWTMYGLCIAAGWIGIQPKHDAATRRFKLFKRFIGPWPLATLEEAVFRGVLLEQLLQSLPQGPVYTLVAIVVTSAIFASIHFVKPSDRSRPVWQPAYGLFIVSCLFGLAYVVGGRSLWLPITMHGAAVFGIEVMRLYVVYRGPPWLIGYAEFPQSGLLGTVFISAMAVALVILV